jgi:adenylate cyclase
MIMEGRSGCWAGWASHLGGRGEQPRSGGQDVGDEVLFVTGQPADAAEIALRLTGPDRDRKGLPALRVGLAAGRVLTRFGDVYGPVVNLAARLTSLARPGTTLVDAELAAALRADGRYRLQHRRPMAVCGYHHLRSWALRPRG